MSTFEFVSVALSLVLGLGMTRLLLSAVYVFKARDRLVLNWTPALWALSIFLYQVQFWWAIYELSVVHNSWTLWEFTTLLVLALILFLAGALIFPDSNEEGFASLSAYFDEDGRYALVAIVLYSVFAYWANWFLWGVSPVSVTGAVVTGNIVLAAAGFLVRDEKISLIIAIVFAALAAYGMLTLAPLEY